MVSIIIPVYNVRDYVIKCLKSVAAQSYSGAIECLIIDDCGQDDSIQLAEDFITSYNGHIEFRIIYHDHNKGLSAARNTGIRESKGEWIYFLDSDDWIIPECIKLMMEQVAMHTNVDIVFAGSMSNHKGYEGWMSITGKNLPCYSTDSQWIAKTMLERIPLSMTAWNRLIRKNLIISRNLYFQEGIIHEDDAWNFLLAFNLSEIAICKRNTYFYTVRENSIMQNNFLSKNNDFNGYKGCLKYVFTLLENSRNKDGIMAVWNYFQKYYCSLNRKNKLFVRVSEIRLGLLCSKTMGLKLIIDAITPCSHECKIR